MKWFAVLALAGLFACGPYTSGLPDYGEVPDFQLTDQSGRIFSGNSLRGKVWVADFFFTNCMGPCPRMSSRLHYIQQHTADLGDLQIASFTIDPASDTPVVMASYAKEHGAVPGRWHFLTGPQPSLNQLCRYVFKLGNVDGSLTHSTKFMLMDRKMRIRGYYDSFDPDNMNQLLKDIRSVARERS